MKRLLVNGVTGFVLGATLAFILFPILTPALGDWGAGVIVWPLCFAVGWFLPEITDYLLAALRRRRAARSERVRW